MNYRSGFCLKCHLYCSIRSPYKSPSFKSCYIFIQFINMVLPENSGHIEVLIYLLWAMYHVGATRNLMGKIITNAIPIFKLRFSTWVLLRTRLGKTNYKMMFST